jgi:hypothetical protein
MRAPRYATAATLVLLAAGPTFAQGPESRKPRTFDIATVKPNASGEGSSQRVSPNGTLTFINNTLRNIIRNAYGLQGAQVVGGPGWLDTDRFDIVAKAGAPFTTDEGRLMLRVLLADRFGVLGRGLRASTEDCTTLAAAQAHLPCGLDVRLAAGVITGRGVSMPQLARNLMNAAGRIVVDDTGLSGGYDVELRFAPDQAADPSVPSLFTALQEQLGLKLEPGRAPISVLVIDRATRPAAD